MKNVKSKAFWEAIAERAVNTFWQAFLATYTVSSALDVNALRAAAYTAGMATLLSMVKGLTVALVTDGNPAIGSTEVLASDGATANPVGEDGQKTVVPDPTGEIAAQIQGQKADQTEAADAAAEAQLDAALPNPAAADVAPAPRHAQVDADDGLGIQVAVPTVTQPVAPATSTTTEDDQQVVDLVPPSTSEADVPVTDAAAPEASDPVMPADIANETVSFAALPKPENI